ncbi:hypothetical protein ZOSMA_350G00150 [Zostera marina]|uniref:Transmembrane protein n=1 Tax=Zostera marina TaxID=29655 RepID=A0A0K9P6U2_ZOSMR|nr:hypothetical protein ZOSMA_350G00150 [Zostera marina]
MAGLFSFVRLAIFLVFVLMMVALEGNFVSATRSLLDEELQPTFFGERKHIMDFLKSIPPPASFWVSKTTSTHN